MTKKILLCCILLLTIKPAKGQILISLLLGDKLNSPKIEFGVDGGLNLTTIQGLNNTKYANYFNLGFYFDFKLHNPAWTFNTGVIVKSNMGAKDLPVYPLSSPDLDTAFVGGSVARKLSYFNVPLLMKYKFKNNLFVKGGIQLGLLSKANDYFYNEVKEKEDLQYRLKTTDNYHRIDAGLVFSLGYRLLRGNGVNIGIQYYYGIVDISKDNSGPAQYNRSIYFNVGIPIGVQPKKKK